MKEKNKRGLEKTKEEKISEDITNFIHLLPSKYLKIKRKD